MCTLCLRINLIYLRFRVIYTVPQGGKHTYGGTHHAYQQHLLREPQAHRPRVRGRPRHLKRIGHEYEAARVERQARKQQIIDTRGWDSDELRAWYAEDQAAKFPFEQGACKAYRAWASSISRKEAELEMDDFLWEKEVRDFVEALRSAGIETFVYTNQSTAVMENLHAFAAEGCTMMGLCTITRQETRWGDEEPYEVQGIRFSLS